MARYIYTNRFITGEISPDLAARTDWERWQNALLRAENVLLSVRGGAAKRPCLEVVAGADGVERIFGWHRTEREKFVVGIKADGGGVIHSVTEGTEVAQPMIDGTLDLEDAEQLNALHYNRTLIITTPGKPPQEIVLQDKDALVAREDLSVLTATHTFAEPQEYGVATFTLAIGEGEDKVEVVMDKLGAGSTFSSGEIGGVTYYFRVARLPVVGSNPVEYRQLTGLLYPYFPFGFGGGNVSFFTREVLAKTITVTATADGEADIVFALTDKDTSVINAAEGFTARKMKFRNPPVKVITATTDQTQAEAYAAEQARIGAGLCFKVEEADKSVGKGKVAIWDGAALTTRDPGEAEVGLPVGSYAMAWNDEDKFPAVAGIRHGRLIFAGSIEFGATFWASVAGDGRDFTAEAYEPIKDDKDLNQTGSKVEADFAMTRTLDSFENIVALNADNALAIFTEGGEWMITGGFDAEKIDSAQARRYSQYGSAQNIGVAAIDQQLFFASGKSAFSMKYDGDDVGYVPTSISEIRNKDALDGEAIRVAATQADDLKGTKLVLFLVDSDAKAVTRRRNGKGDDDFIEAGAALYPNGRYIAAYHTNLQQGFQAWAKWTFPRHRIIDIVSVDREALVLADEMNEDGTTARRAIYRLSNSKAEQMTGAGDELNEGVAIFPCILETPDLVYPRLYGEGWILPKVTGRCHITAERAGGAPDKNDDNLCVFIAGAKGVFRNAPNVDDFPKTKAAAIIAALVRRFFGKRFCEIKARDVDANRDTDEFYTAIVVQANDRPIELHRLDVEMNAEPLGVGGKRR